MKTDFLLLKKIFFPDCGREGNNWILFTTFETGKLAESLIGFPGSVDSVAFLWGEYHMQKSDTFVCPFPFSTYVRVTCLVSRNPKDSGNGALPLLSRS